MEYSYFPSPQFVELELNPNSSYFVLHLCFCLLGLLSLKSKQGGIIALRADSYYKTLKDYKQTHLAPSQKKTKTENNHPTALFTFILRSFISLIYK